MDSPRSSVHGFRKPLTCAQSICLGSQGSQRTRYFGHTGYADAVVSNVGRTEVDVRASPWTWSPRTIQVIVQLIIRMALENRSWDYTRIQGALANWGLTLAVARLRPEFVATFNWVELGDRSLDKFGSDIEKFLPRRTLNSVPTAVTMPRRRVPKMVGVVPSLP
jgi:hypothetical protein